MSIEDHLSVNLGRRTCLLWVALFPELYTHREKELSTSKYAGIYFLSVLDSDWLLQPLTTWMSLQR